jgi:hypothetical protein
MDDQAPAKTTIYVQFSESGTIREWAEYPFDGGVRYIVGDESHKAAMIEGARIALEWAVEVCQNYRAFCGDRPLWPDEPGTTISMLDPATIIAQHVVTPAPE